MKPALWRVILLLIIWATLAARVYQGSPYSLTVALLWCAVLGLFYWNLEVSGKQDKVRAFYFFSLALFFLVGMHLKGFETQGGPNLQPYCHLSLAGNVLSIAGQQVEAILGSTYGRYGVLGAGVFWLLTLIVCGGGFCSRVCFFGGWDDAFSRVMKKPVFHLPGKSRVREFQLALLLFLAFMAYSRQESEFCLWICPFKSPTGEILDPASRAYTAQMITYAAVALVFVALLPILTRKRTFCSTLCPFGALPPLIQKWMPYQVKIDPDTCTSCGICEAECPSFAIETVKKKDAPCQTQEADGSHPTLKRQDIYETKITRYCTLCMRCVPTCPKGGVVPTTSGSKDSAWLDFISLGFGGALSLFYVPPAVLAVVEFVKKVFA